MLLLVAASMGLNAAFSSLAEQANARLGGGLDEVAVKRSFKALAYSLHPDRNAAPNAHHQFQVLTADYKRRLEECKCIGERAQLRSTWLLFGGIVSIAERMCSSFTLGAAFDQTLFGVSLFLAFAIGRHINDVNNEHVCAAETMCTAYAAEDAAASRLVSAQQEASAVAKRLEGARSAEVQASVVEAKAAAKSARAAKAARSVPDELLLKAVAKHVAAEEARVAHAAASSTTVAYRATVRDVQAAAAAVHREVQMAAANMTKFTLELAAARAAFEACAWKVLTWVTFEKEATATVEKMGQLLSALVGAVNELLLGTAARDKMAPSAQSV